MTIIDDHLSRDERRVIQAALATKAPELLAEIKTGQELSPGPRLRLEDLLYDYAQNNMTGDYRHTEESDRAQRLIGKLRRIQPIEYDRLEIGSWKKGDPIPRGMDRYREF